jgi:protein KRI1
LKKKEEVKRLKALKMKELKGKLERIGREGGWKDIEGNEGLRFSYRSMTCTTRSLVR